jgi:uncharacterized membrane protein (DUF485 family)
MDKRTPPTNLPAAGPARHRSGSVEARPRRLPGSGRGWIVVGVGLALLKGRAFAELFHHRPELIAVLAIGVVVSLLRARPIALAAFVAPLLALLLAPGPTAVAVAIGVGIFLALVAAFAALATVLHARQKRAR